MTRTIDQLVSAEVHYCVSSLVATLANGYDGIDSHSDGGGELSALAEQAFELSSPIDDWEEAAIQAGWEMADNGQCRKHYGLGPKFGPHWTWVESWQEACEKDDIEPYDREVFEHWIVSDWLADRLAEKGEKVDKDFAGLTVWARTATGQGIASDSVIEAIYADLTA